MGNGTLLATLLQRNLLAPQRSKAYHDVLDRVVRTENVGLNGVTIYQDTWYDALGRVQKSSDRYFCGRYSAMGRSRYDPLGHITSLTEADGKLTTTTYSGLTTTVQTSGPDIPTHSRTTVKNVKGLVVSTSDSLYPGQARPMPMTLSAT